ncbi:hypothetical protein CCR97_24720 [Rhodoplanes elegans]|uniref:YARHG domain-containing protein n=1 Tax=Rhodoplanes elegans TaxID=29408 RepID=A0A327JXV4_9BRAD|nr:YARHG domain-containing protein [Rhodoplanes elegans]MBK5961384.1 hypothetical protein [Rhodoplanes elegans]RAI31309.1 hypothetical protein CH338_26040 [Rhodoplanes elegans]
MTRTTCLLSAAVALATLLGATEGALAQGMCEQLWVERNSIFKARGYCFKTSRAISYFGNAGCVYDVESMVPLSPGERARVNQIRAMERQYGCR